MTFADIPHLIIHSGYISESIGIPFTQRLHLIAALRFIMLTFLHQLCAKPFDRTRGDFRIATLNSMGVVFENFLEIHQAFIFSF